MQGPKYRKEKNAAYIWNANLQKQTIWQLATVRVCLICAVSAVAGLACLHNVNGDQVAMRQIDRCGRNKIEGGTVSHARSRQRQVVIV